jgi:hypothetical protein
MKTCSQTPDANGVLPVLSRLPRPVWLAIEHCRQQFTTRDLVPYSFGEVMVFLIETYLYERQQIDSPPVLRGRGARQLNRRKLEDENAALRQQLAAALNQKSQENL